MGQLALGTRSSKTKQSQAATGNAARQAGGIDLSTNVFTEVPISSIADLSGRAAQAAARRHLRATRARARDGVRAELARRRRSRRSIPSTTVPETAAVLAVASERARTLHRGGRRRNRRRALGGADLRGRRADRRDAREQVASSSTISEMTGEGLADPRRAARFRVARAVHPRVFEPAACSSCRRS